MLKSLDETIEELRAAGEPTRLRVLALLSAGELSVGELAQVLGQSQPRLSRHMKFLTNSGLVERMPEGAWVFYRLASSGRGRMLADALLSFLDMSDPLLRRDAGRLAEARAARAAAAMSYFERVAAEWDGLRALHYPEDAIEAAILEAAGAGPFDFVIDMGTGTGRMLGLLAERTDRAEGVDLSHQMLTVARANLQAKGVTNVGVRHGDATAAPFDDAVADLVVIHQVLHFLDEPWRALSEAARTLKPGGRVVIVDFAPHDLEYLRRDHAHRHLGVADADVENWVAGAGLSLGATRRFAAPSDAEAGLSVTIWTALSPADATRTKLLNSPIKDAVV